MNAVVPNDLEDVGYLIFLVFSNGMPARRLVVVINIMNNNILTSVKHNFISTAKHYSSGKNN